MKRKPILALDFDGVVHSYASGWKGPRTIPDPPVDGALEYISNAMEFFDVNIFSSRSRYWGGRWAMRRWLVDRYREVAPDWESTPPWFRAQIVGIGPDPWEDEVGYAARRLVRKIGFPRHKPPAMVTLDDRALTFTGKWPRFDELAQFEPWYKRAASGGGHNWEAVQFPDALPGLDPRYQEKIDHHG